MNIENCLEYEVKDKGYTLTYKTVSNDNKSYAIITGIKNLSPDFIDHGILEIPDIINGYDVNYIQRAAFSDNAFIKHVTLPHSLKGISNYAFKSSGVESVFICSGISYIDSYAFENCYNLKEVNFSEGIKTIEFAAFKNCISLESIIFPDSLTELGERALDDCRSLKSIYIGSGLENIGMSHTSDFANGCKSLNMITISPLNKYFKVENDVLYNEPYKTLVKVFNGSVKKDMTIPAWVKEVSIDSFADVKLSCLKIKQKELFGIDSAKIAAATDIYCIPNSHVYKFFKRRGYMVKSSIGENELDNFLNKISDNNIDK